MNPRTLCACQPVAFIIWASVAPPFRWSRPRTSAFLLPSRATAGLSPPLARFPLAALAFAVFAFLGSFADALACWPASGRRCRFRRAAAVQALDRFPDQATADFRSVNFLTGVRPGIPFQTSISRLAGHLAARSASSFWLANISPSKSACWLRRAVMLFSASIVNVVILLLLTAAAVMAFITPKPGTSKSILRILKKNPRRGIRRASWRSGSSLQLAAHRPGSNRRQPRYPPFLRFGSILGPFRRIFAGERERQPNCFMARRGLPGLCPLSDGLI